MTSFRRVTKDALWNLIGQVAPMAAAFFSIPPLMRGLGEARFGVLALAWMVIGYFSFFDLGLGRALTQVVASRIGNDRQDQLPGFIGTAVVALAGLGLLGGVVLALVAPWMVGGFLKVPPELRGETESAFRLMALSVPLVTLTSAFRGLVEARRWFAQLNMIRIPLGLFTFLGPWATVAVAPRLEPVLAVLLAGRLIGTLGHAWLARRAFPEVVVRWKVSGQSLRQLLGLGGWMTATNVVGPLMVNVDRFVIGAMLSLTAVTMYATPYEMVTKLLAVSAALAGALFPAVSAARSEGERPGLRRLYLRACVVLLAVLGPAVLVIVVGARWGMAHWISEEFAAQSSTVLQILAVGVLLNALAAIPFTLIQGLGRPDLTAIVHLLELPAYLAMLWWFIRLDGIRGAAWAWTIRVGCDAGVLALIGQRLLGRGRR